MMMDPIVSASMVLYRSGPKAREAVRCIRESTEKVDLFVIDNSPDDAQSKALCMRYGNEPHITIIQNKRNIGFGRAHNLALPRLKSRYHIFLNPDVTFDPDLIGKMVQYMKENPKVDVLSPRILNMDGTEQLVPRRLPTVRYILGGKLGKRFPQCQAWRDEYTMAGAPITEPTEIEMASGCFLMIRTSALRLLNGFDPHFFLYLEDCDLSRRILEKGGRIVCHPDICVRHAWARDSMHSPKALLRHMASAFRYFMKWGWEM